MLAQALSGLIAPILFLGQQAAALKPRRPSWKPRVNFQIPRLNLRPALKSSRAAFFFLAGLGELVLKAALSALIFLLEQSHRLLKLLWRLLRGFTAVKPAINFDVWRAAKYGSGVLASLAVLVILGLSFSQIQRSWASWRAVKTVPVEIKIQEDYQNASRRTLVKLEPLQILGEQFDGLTMSASFSYAGKSLKQEPANITLLLTSVASGFKYAKRHDLTARADGETIKLGLMNRNGRQVEILNDGKIEVVKPRKKGGGRSAHVLETLTINVPTKTWNKLSQSKEVKMKLGQTEFDLTETHLAALRDMIERATQRAAANQRSSPSSRSR